MKRVYQWLLKTAWVVGHPVSFLSLLSFVWVWVATDRMSNLVGVLSIAVVGVMLGFRFSVLAMSLAFAKSPASVLAALGSWNSGDRFAARIALAKARH